MAHHLRFVLFAALALLLPMRAQAQYDSSSSGTFGAAGFESSSSLLVFSSADSENGGYLVFRVDLNTGIETALVEVNTPASNSLGGLPSVNVAPGTDRALLFNPPSGNTDYFGPQPILFDVDGSNAIPFGPSNQIVNAGFSGAFGPGGKPFGLLGYLPTEGPAVVELLAGSTSSAGVWVTQGTTDFAGNGCSLALVVDSSNRPVGFCDSQPLILGTGGALTLGTAQIGSPILGNSGVMAGTQPVFYAAVQISQDITSIQQGLLSGSNWTWTEIAQVGADTPLLQMTAVDLNDVALSFVDDYGNSGLALLANIAGTWVSVPVGPIGVTDQLTAWNANNLMGASLDLTIYQNGVDGWSTNDLGTIGTSGDWGYGCGCSMERRPGPMGGAVVFGMLIPLLVMLRRRHASRR